MARAWFCAVLAAATVMPLLVGPARAEDGLLARGRYIVTAIGACGTCHTTRDQAMRPIPGMELAGGRVIDDEGVHAIVPNITPDKETGIGLWTDAQIIDAIRNGRRPDGSIIGPPMPIELYRAISDTDVHAIVAYLRQVKPVAHKVGTSTFTIPLPKSYGPPVTHVADVPRSDKLAYGKYVASLGHCMLCHTPVVEGRNVWSKLGAGGRKFMVAGSPVYSANLTPANADGIAKWTDAQIKTAITQGVRPDGRRLAPVMAFAWYKNTTDQDLDALVAYLRSLKPAEAE